MSERTGSTSTGSTPTADPIVVGVDGSPGSLAALDFALHEAQLRHVEARVVWVWHSPETYDWSWVPPADWDPEQEARQNLAAMIEEALAAFRRGTGHLPPVTLITRQGHPGRELLDLATGAGLLVLGCRGHGGFAGLHLGSVSHHCVSHAPCPVAVVPLPSRSPHPAGASAAG